MLHACASLPPPPCSLQAQDSRGQGANAQAFSHHGPVTICAQVPGPLSLAVELPAFYFSVGKGSEPPDSPLVPSSVRP